MKEICRILGALVLILAIVVFVLFKLNGMGFISGSLGTWTNNVVYHVIAIKDDTVVFLHEQGILNNNNSSVTPLPVQETNIGQNSSAVEN